MQPILPLAQAYPNDAPTTTNVTARRCCSRRSTSPPAGSLARRIGVTAAASSCSSCALSMPIRLRNAHPALYPAWHPPLDTSTRTGNPPAHRNQQRRSEAVRLIQDRRRHPRQHRAVLYAKFRLTTLAQRCHRSLCQAPNRGQWKE